MKKAKQTQANYSDKNCQPTNFQIGDLVFLQTKSKRINMTSDRDNIIASQIKHPMSVLLSNMLDGSTTKAHAQHLRLAKIDEWEIPKTPQGTRLRRAHYAIPPESESLNHDDPNDHEAGTPDQNSHSPSDTSDNESQHALPIAKLASKYRTVRDHSSSESDIPLLELSNWIITHKKRQLRQADSDSPDSDYASVTQSDEVMTELVKYSQTPKKTSKSRRSQVKSIIISSFYNHKFRQLLNISVEGVF